MTDRRMRALALDAYGTIFDVFSVTGRCEQLFPGNGEALARLWRAKQLQYSLLRSLMGRYRDFWQITEDALGYAATSLGLDLTPEARRALGDEYLKLAAFPDARPGLAALKGLGLRLVILSNGAPRMLAAAAHYSGMAEYFDAILSADHVKVFKPSPDVYRLALSDLNLDAGELAFVSSNSWDICGAASAGLSTFWIQRNTLEPPEELGYTADRIVPSLTALAGLLQ